MKTAILTDSNSGIFPEEGERLGIFVLPMPVILDGKEYFEGVNLTPNEFYQHIAEGADVSTSQPSPGDVISMFDRIFSEGYDELVYIPCPVVSAPLIKQRKCFRKSTRKGPRSWTTIGSL